jgi:hypothetical protein
MSKQLPLQDSLSVWADEVRERAAMTAPGPEQDAFLMKIVQADKATKTLQLDQLAGASTAEMIHGPIVLSFALAPSGSGIGKLVRVRLINTSMLDMIDGDDFTQRNSSRSLSSASRAPAAYARPFLTRCLLISTLLRGRPESLWSAAVIMIEGRVRGNWVVAQLVHSPDLAGLPNMADQCCDG